MHKYRDLVGKMPEICAISAKSNVNGGYLVQFRK